jgi:hypothetical protein
VAGWKQAGASREATVVGLPPAGVNCRSEQVQEPAVT